MIERQAIIIGGKKRASQPTRRLIRRLVGVLAGILATSYVFWAMGEIDEQTRVKQALIDISRIEHAARLFRADHGRCPDGLEELVSPPGDALYLTGYQDPWGQSYRLTCPAQFDEGGVQVTSGGPDRSFEGNDTISSL